MKYFTPELIAMGQTDDEQVLSRQEQLWEEAGERYVAYLDTVRPQFPPGMRRLDEHYYLHDASIRAMGRQDHAFVIVLQLDTPPYSLLMLTYDLVGEPVIMADAVTAGHVDPGRQVDWLYDEIELVPGKPPTWAMSILLSNGWEAQVHFRDVQVQEVQPLLPQRNSRSGSPRGAECQPAG